MAKEYDANLIIEDRIGNYDIKFYNPITEPFRMYGMWHDGEKYCRLPKTIASTISEGISNVYGSTSGGRIRFVTNSSFVAVKIFAIFVSSF